MPSNYPSSFDSFGAPAAADSTNVAIGGRTHSASHTDLGDAVEAIQSTLGTAPAGAYPTIKARLDGGDGDQQRRLRAGISWVNGSHSTVPPPQASQQAVVKASADIMLTHINNFGVVLGATANESTAYASYDGLSTFDTRISNLTSSTLKNAEGIVGIVLAMAPYFMHVFADQQVITSITVTGGNTASCTAAAHGFTNGQTLAIRPTTGIAGMPTVTTNYTITVVDANTFTFTQTGLTNGTYASLSTKCGTPNGGASINGTRVDPDYESTWAGLCAFLAQRYPAVTHFVVWNELKGYYNAALNRWDYEAYTTMYNKVWTAIKAVRPQAQIGGPYMTTTPDHVGRVTGSGVAARTPSLGTEADQVGRASDNFYVSSRTLDPAIYFSLNAVGYDFVAFDMWGTRTDNGVVLDLVPYYRQIAEFFRRRFPSVPIMVTEAYWDVTGKGAAGLSEMLSQLRAGGVDYAALWHDPGTTGGDALYSLTSPFGATSTGIAMQAWNDAQPLGTEATDRSTLSFLAGDVYVQNYAGYDSDNAVTAMTVWMQALLDGIDRRRPVNVPRRPDGGKWNLQFYESTSSTALPATSAAGQTITVASATNLPTVAPFKVVLDANTNNSEVVNVIGISGTTLTLGPRVVDTNNPHYSAKAHSGTYSVIRALPYLDNLKLKGMYPAGSEGGPCAIKVVGGSFFFGGGTSNAVDGVEIEDVSLWCSENYSATSSSPRALHYPNSIGSMKDCRFNRVHFKWFTSIRFVMGRSRVTHCYINNGYAFNSSGQRVTPTGQGLVDLTGSDNVMQDVYLDTAQIGIPSDQSLIRIGWSMSQVHNVYVTPAPGRPVEIAGYVSGLQASLIVNGLNVHNTRVAGASPIGFGLAASRPTAATWLTGYLYESTDTGVIERCTGSAWVQVTSNTTLLAGSPYTNVAALPAASSNTGRWATVSASETSTIGGMRTFYSDGTRWRGPMFDVSASNNLGSRQYLGADYGIWIHDTTGTVQLSQVWLRQVAQFDSAFPGAIRVENAQVEIGNLALEQSYGTDIYVSNGVLQIGNVAKDGVVDATLSKTLVSGGVARKATLNTGPSSTQL